MMSDSLAERERTLPRKERTRADASQHLERLAWLLDDLIRIPVLGWRIGLDAILGLIPGIGDAATSLASIYILLSAVRFGVPKITLARMGLNIGIDYVLGAVPLVGDLFDASWKSNRRNLDLLRRHMQLPGHNARRARMSDWLFVTLIAVALIGLLFASFFVAVYALSRLARLAD